MVKFILISILVSVLIPVLLGIGWTKAAGVSMEPTLSDGDIVVFMDSWNVDPGDIVIFKTPEWENWPKEEQI